MMMRHQTNDKDLFADIWARDEYAFWTQFEEDARDINQSLLHLLGTYTAALHVI